MSGDKTNIDNIWFPFLGPIVGTALCVGSIYLLLFFVSLLGFESPINDKYFSPTWLGNSIYKLIPGTENEQTTN